MQTKISNATKNARAKAGKAPLKRKAGKGLIAQRAMKNAYEKEVRGLNALVNYCTGKGKFKDFKDGVVATQGYINYVNERDNVTIKLSDITLKSIKEHLTDKELFKKDGSRKELFTTHHVKLAISRMAKK
jgi:hypothetical protein